jgi:hypothetical protein
LSRALLAFERKMSRKRCHVPAMSIEHKAQRGSGGTGRAVAEQAAEQAAEQTADQTAGPATAEARNDRPGGPVEGRR